MSDDTPSKVLVVGVGSRIKGDDIIGPMTCDRLRKMIAGKEEGMGFEIDIIDADVMPENFGKPIKESKADRILFIDAANMGTEPGTIMKIPRNLISSTIPTTHTLPLDIFIEHIMKDVNEVTVIGVEPLQTVSFTKPSKIALESSSRVAEMILNWTVEDIPTLEK